MSVTGMDDDGSGVGLTGVQSSQSSATTRPANRGRRLTAVNALGEGPEIVAIKSKMDSYKVEFGEEQWGALDKKQRVAVLSGRAGLSSSEYDDVAAAVLPNDHTIAGAPAVLNLTSLVQQHVQGGPSGSAVVAQQALAADCRSNGSSNSSTASPALRRRVVDSQAVTAATTRQATSRTNFRAVMEVNSTIARAALGQATAADAPESAHEMFLNYTASELGSAKKSATRMQAWYRGRSSRKQFVNGLENDLDLLMTKY